MLQVEEALYRRMHKYNSADQLKTSEYIEVFVFLKICFTYIIVLVYGI